MGMLYKTRGGRQRFFCASPLASAKPKKAQKSKEKEHKKKQKYLAQKVKRMHLLFSSSYNMQHWKPKGCVCDGCV
jgi:hypothetical protein